LINWIDVLWLWPLLDPPNAKTAIMDMEILVEKTIGLIFMIALRPRIYRIALGGRSQELSYAMLGK
jgi:hypothetical protein